MPFCTCFIIWSNISNKIVAVQGKLRPIKGLYGARMHTLDTRLTVNGLHRYRPLDICEDVASLKEKNVHEALRVTTGCLYIIILY